MLETSARLLALLSLLQQRREWSGRELADRLEITTCTVRRDVGKLRDLGYPIEADVGVRGGYRLGAGAEMPPLLLDDQEVLAVALGLDAVTTGPVADMAEASAGALAKLRQVMPSRLRHRLDALRIEAVPRHERLRFDYRRDDGDESRREIEPYRLVRNGNRWYLVGFDIGRDDWRSFRVDRMEPRTPTGPRFTPRELPAGGAAAFVARGLGAVHQRAAARIRVHAPLDEIAPMVHESWGTLETGTESGEAGCVVAVHGSSFATIARWLYLFDADFTVLEPEELRDELAAVAEYHARIAARYRRAITARSDR